MSRRSPKPIPRCSCGLTAMVKTSWTNWNPARRFVVCTLGEDEGCGFWEWYDPTMCERSTQVIPGLLRRMNRMESNMEELETSARRWENKAQKLELKVAKLEGEVKKHKTREHYLKRALLGTWAFILLYCFCCYLKTVIKSDHMLAIKG
ncbi:uncharacterized protein LOC113776817 [Coffea eugenioides]|uniref:uncharacterized protein LOC113771029 n=1 Tax=Coffea eugenioides TaxID=49369 RepID=UPI000F5CC95B|nr:uncharacterized protein LOC113695242 [Coffea arabica]XP_027171459.1 uncharacterized protein LOC113771029 [Coffea eugenioides]XP_027177676.1 uncharacterized protein LOC113776817 [Coffea eugenioides]